MSGAHAAFELIGSRVIALEREQSRGQYVDLGLGLLAEKIEQRDVARVVRAHARLRLKVANNSCSSSRATERSCHGSRLLEYRTVAFARVSGISLSAVGRKR